MSNMNSPISESQPLLSNGQLENPDLQRSRRACFFILISQFLQRVAFYSIICNLVYFLNRNPYHWSSDNAMITVFIFTGVSYCVAVFGGWLADAAIGKFRVIAIGYFFCCIFYIVFPMLYFDTMDGVAFQSEPAKFCFVRNRSHSQGGDPSGTPKDNLPQEVTMGDESCVVWIIVSLVMIGIGDAFIRSVISPFGADQLYHDDPNTLRNFFNWYYWALNAGSLVAYLVFAYVQQNVSIFWGYMVPYIMLLCSAFCFFCGRPYYMVRQSRGMTLISVFGVLGLSLKRRCGSSRRRRRMMQEDVMASTASTSFSGSESDTSAEPNWMDLAKIRYGGRYPEITVNEVRAFLQVLIVLLILIFYFVSYFQMETTFKIQGLHMKIDFLDNDFFYIPVAWLTLVNILTVLIVLPIINEIIYPWLDRNALPPTLRSRMLVGMLFAVLAMVTAGLIEHYRLDSFWGPQNTKPFHPQGAHRQSIGNTTYWAAELPIYYQIPQYMLVGLSEILTSVSGLEFAYTHAPRNMQSLVTGVFWMSSGLGSLLGSVVLALTRNRLLFSVDYGDINCRLPCAQHGPGRQETCHACHLDYYFYILAALQLVTMGIFALVAWVVLPRSQNSGIVVQKLTSSGRRRIGDHLSPNETRRRRPQGWSPYRRVNVVNRVQRQPQTSGLGISV